MIVYDFDQRTEAWEEQRRGKITASRISELISPARFNVSAQKRIDLAAKMAAEKLGIASPPPLPSWAMQRGTELEDEARKAYERETGRKISTVGFCQIKEDDNFGCSPDGFIINDDFEPIGLIEIKCPLNETAIKYVFKNEVPREYRLQLQFQLWVTGLFWVDFYVYSPDIPSLLIRVERDEEAIEMIANEVNELNQVVDSVIRRLKNGDV